MGKSHKKVKNDRINTLRKQYDAYLEEDKKRKERNEYILGKLDKMRSPTALVPISTKANYYHDINPSNVYMRPENVRNTITVCDNYVPHLEQQNMKSDILTNKQFDESIILKEISKRYILIPKGRTPIHINELASNKDAINGDDWRSKYNILDNLKKQEKEGGSDTAIKQNKEIFNSSYQDSEFIYDKESQNIGKDLSPIIGDKYNDMMNVNKLSSLEERDNKDQKNVDFIIPEINTQVDKKSTDAMLTTPQSLNEESLNIQSSHITDQIDMPVTNERIQPYEENIEEKEKYCSDINEKHFNYQPTQDINSDMQIGEENTVDIKHYQETMGLSTYNQSMPENNECKGNENEAIVSDIKQQESTVAEFSEKNKNPSENIENKKDARKAQDLLHPEQINMTQYDDTDDNPGGRTEEDQPTYNTPQNYDPAPDNTPVARENTEHVDHESEINAFEEEQKGMFYTEETGGDAYAYNQGDANTGEYTNENYDQNDQYAYFEGVQQEQAYATNVNEHEEATERYDPHYNQQYEGTYDNQQSDITTVYDNTYEQQQYEEGNYENPPYINVNNYDSQQENANIYQQETVSNENEVQKNVPQGNEVYDQHLYTEQTDTQENIEQQLITEEGYVENSSVNVNESKKEPESETEIVMDVTNPVEQMPDPKFS